MEKYIRKCIIFIGIQASGKSTFYHRVLESEGFVHVNLDSLHTRTREQELITRCIHEQLSFVVDNTNPTRNDRERYISQAKAAGYRIEGYFFKSVLHDCITRNESRAERIPNKAIANTSNRLELPNYSEGFDELYFVCIEGDKFNISNWRE